MIEDLMTQLIAALAANTAALNGKTNTGKPASAEKPAGKPASAEKPAGKPAGKPASKKGPTVADVTALAGKMLNGETALDLADAKAALSAFKANRGYKVSETPAEDIETALADLNAFIAGEDPYAESDSDDGDEDLM